MGVAVTINGITGQSPYDLYICQPNGLDCFYIDTIDSIPYMFNIPEPYDTSSSYMLKIIDANGCIITGVKSVS